MPRAHSPDPATSSKKPKTELEGDTPSQVAHRPDTGQRGTTLNVLVNLYPIDLRGADRTIHVYRLEFERDLPKVEVGQTRPLPELKVLSALARKLFAALKANPPSSVASAVKLLVHDGLNLAAGPGPTIANQKISVELPPFKEGAQPGHFLVCFERVKTMSLNDLTAFCASQPGSTNALLGFQVLNIVLEYEQRSRAIANNEIAIVGGKGTKFYNRRTSQPLGGGIEILQGYFHSVRPTVVGPCLNKDTAYGAFVIGGELFSVIQTLTGRPANQMNDASHTRISRLLDKAIIRLIHRGVDATFRGLSLKSAQESMFQHGEGEDARPISVAQYFQNYKNITLKHPHFPCVRVGDHELIPCELVYLHPGHAVPFGQLTPEQTQGMLKVSAKRPNERQAAMQADAGDHLHSWRISAAREMMQVKARLLPPPRLVFHAQTAPPLVNSGAWNVTRAKYVQGATLHCWAVLNLDPKVTKVAAENFVMATVSSLQARGVTVTQPQPIIAMQSGGKQEQIGAAIRNVAMASYKLKKTHPQLLLVIFPTRDDYEYVKRYTFFDGPIVLPTQGVMGSKLAKGGDQYTNNVALKMNIKLGGTNWTLNRDDMPQVTDATMLFGMDVSHSGPGGLGGSVAAVVANADRSFGAINTELRIQAPRVERVEDLQSMVKNLIVKWANSAKILPDRIIMYRDGLSDGELETTALHEIEDIRKACNSIRAGWMPSLTFAVCGKRHHIRFFSTSPRDAEKNGNLLPGVVVEDQVAHPRYWDFFLQSHSGLIGTARPCHIIVLLDENGFSADSFQRLTHTLAFNLPRATRSISRPSPTYLADIACRKGFILSEGKTDPMAIQNRIEAFPTLAPMFWI